MLIEPAVERAALEAAKANDLTASPTLVYLANGISDGKEADPLLDRRRDGSERAADACGFEMVAEG